MPDVSLLWKSFVLSGTDFVVKNKPYLISLIQRFRQSSDILPAIVADLFPTLVSVATQMIQTPPSLSQEIPTMLHLILKTYRTSIILNLSDHQQNSESLVPWCQLFFGVVNIRLPKDCVPVDEDDRQKCEWWKAKKWAYADLGRLFHRLGLDFRILSFAHSFKGSATLPSFQVPWKRHIPNSPKTLFLHLLLKSSTLICIK